MADGHGPPVAAAAPKGPSGFSRRPAVKAPASTASALSPAAQAFLTLGICETLAEAAAALGWKEPTEIQKQAVPYALEGA